eukprot:CAMPEP_0201516424 /NCGR_PEP_ID=MMETSP0161_2-20130828/7757_1 /ASSEMBLY_ACC=CAM_ASM_000251 /TAXON_ID=180227 /ORGANISM="Neoparamoeba aestuarina, Strain SoJaBio B1-5/56/2" /LENGTH=239 /DNA_ID=CAMNT_0047913559 /DNA_START=471 /DNA_END=1190 /DNA_ORIENTATION=+
MIGSEGFLTRNCGTPLYEAPEVYLKGPYDLRADYWSLGVMMFEMMFGRVPWWTKDNELRKDIEFFEGELPDHLKKVGDQPRSLHRAILAEKLPPLPSNSFSQPCKDFLNLLCSPQATRLQDFQQAKEHPFFEGLNWEDIRLQKVKAPIQPRTDQVNVSVEVTVDAEIFELESPGAPKAKIDDKNNKKREAFEKWDWLCEDWACEELEAEMAKEDEMTTKGGEKETKKEKKKGLRFSTSK